MDIPHYLAVAKLDVSINCYMQFVMLPCLPCILIGDSLRIHNGMKFSTKDQGNNMAGWVCSRRYHGAWWYKNCHECNLNGVLPGERAGKYDNCAVYVTWRSLQGTFKVLKATVMMMRPTNFKP